MVHAFDDSQPAASAHRRTAARVFGRSVSTPGGHSRVAQKSTSHKRCVAPSTRTTMTSFQPRKNEFRTRCAGARLGRPISALFGPTRARANSALRAPEGRVRSSHGTYSKAQAPLRRAGARVCAHARHRVASGGHITEPIEVCAVSEAVLEDLEADLPLILPLDFALRWTCPKPSFSPLELV